MARKKRSLQGVYRGLMSAPRIETETKSSEWVLEYVLRHCNEAWVISELLRVLPVSNENLKLKKMILLKRISLEASKGFVSEKILDDLQALKELNRQLCKKNERSIQELCYKVAAECTVKHLRGGKFDWEGYKEAEKKLWSDRIEDTEDVEEMDCGNYKRIKRDLVAVSSDSRLVDKLLQNYRQEDVLNSVSAFLKDAWEEMGPTFLDRVAGDVVEGRYNLCGRVSNPVLPSGRVPVPPCETGSPAAAAELPETTSPAVASELPVTTSPAVAAELPETASPADKLPQTESPAGVKIPETASPEGAKSPDVESPATAKLPETASLAAFKIAETERPAAAKVPEKDVAITSTFPPPWAGADLSKGRKKMRHNLKEGPARLSKKRALDSQNGQILTNRKVPGCEPIVINLEEIEVSEKDRPIRKKVTVVAAQGVKESMQNLEDVNSQGRLRSKTVQISVQDDSIRKNATVRAAHEEGKESVQYFEDMNAPERLSLKTVQISEQDDSIRKEVTVKDAHKGEEESAKDHDDVNAQERLRSTTVHNPNNKGFLSPAFVKITEELRHSTVELHSRVEDPLPGALRLAQDCSAREESFPSNVYLDGKKSLENPTNEVDKSVLPENNTGIDNEVQHIEERRRTRQSGESHSEPVKVNIMDRNPTAHTYQWDEEDSIDSPAEKSPSASRKIHLPSPSRRYVSPLKHPHAAANALRRRKHTKWSAVEEETLKNEVQKYGKGRWKFILEKNRHIFEERTEVDLKDKWRNIERREGLHAP